MIKRKELQALRGDIASLREQGFELTRDEIEALVQSDADMWPAMASRIHPRLQGCSLRSM